MRVNTNSTALSASIELDFDSQIIQGLSHRLTTGQRINQASDDPAGLAISEGLMANVRGTQMAVQNVQDSISLLQTAEGGVSDIVNSMQRMRVLALQSANDTYTDDQRQQMQGEVEQLKAHIDQVARQTEFNGISLLDGTFNVTFPPASSNRGNFLVDNSMNFLPAPSRPSLGLVVTSAGGVQVASPGFQLQIGRPAGNLPANPPIRDNNLSVLNQLVNQINGLQAGVSASLVGDVTGTGHALSLTPGPGLSYQFIDADVPVIMPVTTITGLNNRTLTQQGQYLNVQAGSSSNSGIPLIIPSMRLSDLQLDTINITTSSSAQQAIQMVDAAVQQVAGDVAVLGGDENRLTQAEIAISNENEQLTIAHSNLVDANVAQDASALAKEQLVLGVGQSVLQKTISDTYALSVFTVSGLRQRFPLVGAHLQG
jgi:flagellin